MNKHGTHAPMDLAYVWVFLMVLAIILMVKLVDAHSRQPHTHRTTAELEHRPNGFLPERSFAPVDELVSRACGQVELLFHGVRCR